MSRLEQLRAAYDAAMDAVEDCALEGLAAYGPRCEQAGTEVPWFDATAREAAILREFAAAQRRVLTEAA